MKESENLNINLNEDELTNLNIDKASEPSPEMRRINESLIAHEKKRIEEEKKR
mgnify:CR=1 FL=1